MAPMETTRTFADVTGVSEMSIAGGWQLRLSPEGLDLTKANPPESRHVPRNRALESIERTGLRFPNPFFVVREPKRRAFRVDRDKAELIDMWLGDQFGPELKHQLGHRMASAIPMGLLYFVGNHIDWSSWTFGTILVVEGILFRLRPSSWLFLLDLMFWAALIARCSIALADRPSIFQGAMAAFSLLMFSVSFRMFRVLRRGISGGRQLGQRPA